ncbi:hypothetical protein [Pediococcus ethanolidurans]|uniref:Uncharacterized protein n=1 Tax=Pediococcus ethanolidurans TaxID=319653 RepID=A0A0R2K5L2_9LACO|nr:hypothetical protein [Pediococcus ethanolidurans]KRN81719.1 hypothetical protein IV87_GL001012 [Pediococcus ethanolidurans]MDV7719284.1 hypothetical protein [Pediococcus ethanolidurans]GEN95770.1 hypothetical protein PET01_18200 [Pediococcus ethanolidurans]SER84659.1 hypothetical protein SAMN04487973_12028 [Pediococcus ethanolidurans]
MGLIVYIIFMLLVVLYILVRLIRAIRKRKFFDLEVLIWFLVLIAVLLSVFGVVLFTTNGLLVK